MMTSLDEARAALRETAAKRYRVAYNLTTWNGDYETALIAAADYISLLEADTLIDAQAAEIERLREALRGIHNFTKAKRGDIALFVASWTAKTLIEPAANVLNGVED